MNKHVNNIPFLAIIPCLNEDRHIRKLVSSLVYANQDMAMRLVIVDGGSHDNTQAIAAELSGEYPQVEYLYNPARLQSAAVNLAVNTFGDGARYLIRLDAHATYPEEFCRALIEDAEHRDASSVVVSMNTLGEAGFQKAVAAAQNSKLGNGGAAHRLDSTEGSWVDHGHHALMRIDAFRAVEGYDESFSHNEDAELDHRLHLNGGSIWLTAKTDMTYYPRDAAVPLFKQYYRFGKGRVRNIVKHRLRPKLRQMLPTAVAPAAFLALLTPLTFLACLPFLLWSVTCLAYGIKLAADHNDPILLLSGPAAMIMHMGWSFGFWAGLVPALKRYYS